MRKFQKSQEKSSHFLKMSNRRIIHIFDDAIIANDTIHLYKKTRIPNQVFYIISNREEYWSKVNPEVKTIPHNKNTPSLINAIIEDTDVVIMQALSYEKAKAIRNNNNSSVYFIWALWGYGLYNILNYYKKDKTTFNTSLKVKNSLLTKLKNWYTFKIIYPSAVKKLGTCLFLLESDFNALKSVIDTNANWKTTCYQTLNNIFGNLDEFSVSGNSVLLGNSSTPSNNHSEAFRHINLAKDQKIILPLSYGDIQYRDQIVAIGEERFKESFVPLIEFMPLTKYLDQLKECQYVVMAHERQQAFGTMLMMLLAGSKLFLSVKSPLYNWFLDQEVYVFSMEDELETGLINPLTEQQKTHNKKILSTFMAEDVIIKQLEDVILHAKT